MYHQMEHQDMQGQKWVSERIDIKESKEPSPKRWNWFYIGLLILCIIFIIMKWKWIRIKS